MTLYYVRAEAHTGDADGPVNMDLFVFAGSVPAAVVQWKVHYPAGDWDDPDDDKVTVYELPADQPGVAMAIDWETLNPVEIKL